MTTESTAVRLDIEVDVGVARAFQVFTQRFDAIKPRDHNLMGVDIAETVLEPWPGGRMYDRGVDGTMCQWGRVSMVEAPHRLVFSWDISPRWQVQDDPDLASEVECTFAPAGDTRTHLVLEHRGLDRHGEGWQDMRSAVASEHGWPIYLANFRSAALLS